MKPKVLFFDLETTGLDTKANDIVQIGAILTEFDRNKKVFTPVDGFSGFIQPVNKDTISNEALKVIGYSFDDLFKEPFEPAPDVAKRFFKWLDSNVDKYNPNDKILLSGYNIISFDVPFLREFFNRYYNSEYPMFGAYFHNQYFDIMHETASMYFLHSEFNKYPTCDVVRTNKSGTEYTKKKVSFKLGVLCDHFNIKLENAHDAEADILATIKCANVLMDLYKKVF